MTTPTIERLPAPPDGAAELATLLCVAVRIEPDLIRLTRLSLLPHLDVGAEADLWFSSWVAFHESDAIILRLEVVTHLRRRLADRLARDASGTDAARRVWEVVSKAHAGQSAALRLEEHIAWLSVQPEPADLDAALLPVLRAALDGAATGGDVVHWFTRAWPRLPDAARQTVTAWKIAQIARTRVPHASLVTPGEVNGLDLSDVSDIARQVDDVDLPVHHDGARVVLGESASRASTVRVPDTDPRIMDVTWIAGAGAQTRTVYVPAGGTVSLPVGPDEAWLRTARGVLYALAPPSAGTVTGPAIHLAYAFDTAAHHRAVYELWRLLRRAGLDVTIGEAPPEADPPDGNRDIWADQQMDAASHILVFANHAAATTGDNYIDVPVSRLLRLDPDRRPRVLAILLPGDSRTQLPQYIRSLALPTLDVLELTASGIRPLVDILHGQASVTMATDRPSYVRPTRDSDRTPETGGKVVTFYSYSGAEGRTMALANVAWILAANGKRVLVVDWHLDSPGLHRYFHPFIHRDALSNTRGILDLIREYEWVATAPRVGGDRPGPLEEYARVRRHAFTLDWSRFPDGGTLDFLTAGQQSRDYATSLAGMNWDDFYSLLDGGLFFDALRADMKRHYDYVLIDSAPGLSDIADICTVHLPDVVVDCFTLAERSIDGAAQVAQRIRDRSRPNSPIRVLPVPTRVDPAEKAAAERALTHARARFAGLPDHLDAAARELYWASISVPYQAFYAYEEMLATFADRPGTPGMLLSAYERLTAYLTDNEVTRLPPIDESLRQRIQAQFVRQATVVDEVILRYAPDDDVWAEWIEYVLVNAGLHVQVPSTDPYARTSADTPTTCEVIIVSSVSSTHETGEAPVRSDGQPTIAIYVADVPPLQNVPVADSVSIVGLPADIAAQRILGPFSLRGDIAIEGGPRFPGTEPAVFGVPARNARFTGRTSDLRHVRAALRAAGTVALTGPQSVALHGMGGIGKTQLAMEYAHRYRAAYDVVWWINADPQSFVDGGLGELSQWLGLTTRSGPDDLRAVLAALSRGEPYSRWLLIFDNAEDAEGIRPLIPRGRGHVLITTRNVLWSDQAELLQVDVFQRRESIEHLRKRRPTISADEANRVAEVLGDLPIAVSAAGAWLADTDASVADYLSVLEQHGSGQTIDALSDSVSATWDVSLDRLGQRSPAALRLFELCSVLAPEIATELVYSDAMANLLLHYDPALSDRLMRGVLVQQLNRLALIKLDLPRDGYRALGGQIRIHRLLQYVVRSRMSPSELADVKHQIHLVLAALHPYGDVDDPQTWPSYRMLWPHLESSDATTCTAEPVRQLMIDRIRYLHIRGDLDHALDRAESTERSWTSFPETVDDRQLLQLRFNRAGILRDLGRFTDARDIDAAALADQQAILGPVHPHTLMTAGGLAADLRALGQYADALELDQRTWAVWLDHFGEDHPRTLAALSDLAASHRLLGDYQGARERDEQVLNRSRMVLGESHLRTLDSACNLGRDLRDAGDYPRSIDLLNSAAATYEEVWGAEAPGTLTARANLAVSLRAAGQARDAANLLAATHERLNDLFGPRHPDTMACRMSLAVSLLALDEADRADRELQAVHELYADQLGPHHPCTLACLNNLAIAARARTDLQVARTLVADASENLAARLGLDHPHTLLAQMNLAICMSELGDHEAALTQLGDTANRVARVLGPDHPNTLRCRINLALLQQPSQTNELDDAVQRLANVIGDGHPAVMAARERRLLHHMIDPIATNRSST